MYNSLGSDWVCDQYDDQYNLSIIIHRLIFIVLKLNICRFVTSTSMMIHESYANVRDQYDGTQIISIVREMNQMNLIPFKLVQAIRSLS